GARAAGGHLDKRSVMEDDIGRHALRFRQFQASGAQLLEQCAVGRRKCIPRLPTSGLPFPPGLLQDTQVQRWLLTQELAALLRDVQAAMARDIHCDEPVGDELADNRAPGIAVMLAADAESGELVMVQAPDALIRLAQENRNHMRLAEALAGAVDAGQKLLGGDGAVENLGRIETDIAIAARPAVIAEIAQED